MKTFTITFATALLGKVAFAAPVDSARTPFAIAAGLEKRQSNADWTIVFCKHHSTTFVCHL
jgi:hypothetical protein